MIALALKKMGINGFFNREIRLTIIGYGVIAAVCLVVSIFIVERHDADVVAAIQHFRELQLTTTKREAEKLESSLNHLYQSLRTISLIPGIRNLERHAEGVNDETLIVISQLYQNLTYDLGVSEIYIVPADFEPDHVDLKTHKTEEPSLSFDGLIGRDQSPAGAARITPHIPGNETELGAADPDQGTETEEYYLIKDQLKWLQRNAPKLEVGFETSVPFVSGQEVITCDNSEYKTSHNDADRRGLIFSVPFYAADGTLKGVVSAIVRSNTIRKLLPRDSMLINRGYGVEIMGARQVLGDRSFEYARKLRPDPNLLYSTVQEIDTADAGGHWVIWDGEANRTFDRSPEVKAAHWSYMASSAIVIVLTICALLVWTLIQRTIKAKAENERDLIRKVSERTSDFEALMETTLQAGVEAERNKREALREANALLEEFVAHAPAAIAMLDTDLTYIAHTRRWSAEHAAENDVLVGMHQFDAVPALGWAWEEIYRSCLAGRVEYRESDPFPQADGTIKWLTWEIRPWHATNGTIRGLIMMTEDNTARKEIEFELQKALQTAESAASAKADFLANMSHELRTPLSGIIGTADIILSDEDSLTIEHRKMIEMQRNCGSDLLTIVNDILDFSKADAGNLRLEAIPVDISGMISGCIATVQPSVDRKALAIETKIDSGVPTSILGDPTRLRQVMLNLLSNAVKFTPEQGSIHIRVAMTGPKRIRFAVSDTGIGISQEQIASLFTRFSQADTSTTRNFGGTGLGLAICRQFIELMHGTIDVTSKPGLGSTFFFDIPSIAVEEVAAAVSHPAPTTSGVFAHNVLVAEDNATNRLLISKMLEKYGFAYTLVTNGREAVEALTNPAGHDFDIVLMDIQMPEMDGQEATRLIRAFESEHNDALRIPIVALTANGFPEEVKQYLAVGMDTHLLKPIDWPKLFATIDAMALDRSLETAPTTVPTTVDSVAEPEHLATQEHDNDVAAAIDQATLNDLRETLGTETADEIVGMFASELDDRLTRMTASAAAGGAAAEAHALASAARSIGCVKLADLCKELERSVRDGETDIGSKLSEILTAAASAGKAIAKLREAG